MSVFGSRRLRRMAIIWVALATLPCVQLSGDDLPRSEVEIRYLNGVYEDLDSRLEPVRHGGLTVRFSSPEHHLRVHGNRLRLVALGGGRVAASVEVDFEGSGRLFADVEGIGRFADRVEAPRQSAVASGSVRLARLASGYLFTVESADPFVRLEIKSGVAGQIVSACRAAAMIPFVNLPCDGLDTALSSVRVPMPGPGEQFLLPSAEMTAEERAFLDRFSAAE